MSKNPAKPVTGSPSSAQPMPGLSKRAQELLKPRSMHFRCLAIEPAGGGLQRNFKSKAAI